MTPFRPGVPRSLTLTLIALVLTTTGACSSDEPTNVSTAQSTTSDVPASTSTPPSTEPASGTPASPATTGGTASTAAAAAKPPATTARAATTSSNPGPNTTEAPGTTQPAATTTTAASPPPGGQAAITIQNFTFSPPVLTVARGTTVRATNRDAASHTWTADNGGWDSKTLAQNASFSHTFAAAGTYNYHCSIHPSMKGAVSVSG